MKLKIKRVSIIDPGAFGVLLDENSVPFAVTLEHTYGVNIKGEQHLKIDPGTYQCTRTHYHEGNYTTFEIHVPGHSRILFHKANVEDDLDGCVGVAEEFGVLDGKPAILQSGTHPDKGFNEFMKKVEGLDWFDLVVE